MERGLQGGRWIATTTLPGAPPTSWLNFTTPIYGSTNWNSTLALSASQWPSRDPWNWQIAPLTSSSSAKSNDLRTLKIDSVSYYWINFKKKLHASLSKKLLLTSSAPTSDGSFEFCYCIGLDVKYQKDSTRMMFRSGVILFIFCTVVLHEVNFHIFWVL